MATLDLPTLTDCGCKARVYGDGSGVDIDYCPLHSQAPEMLAKLRQMLEMHDLKYIPQANHYVPFWVEVRELIRKAEAWG